MLKKETKYGTAIAEIGEEKKIVAIVAMPLPKMGGEKKIAVAEIWGGIKKKKKMLRSQYFYNIFTTKHRWLVIINSNLKLILRLPI